jgi:hypothetical protein
VLREKQSADVYDLRTGSPIAIGLSACLLESPSDYEAILDGPNDQTKTAMLACARLIRAPLSIEKVATNLNSKDKVLALAAERYLISEDSAEARRIVLSLHPNEAMILGATTRFGDGDGSSGVSAPFLAGLFASVLPSDFISRFMYFGEYDTQISRIDEGKLRKEVKETPELLGLYNWRENYIRIYKDRAVFSWEEDPARYRERVLTEEEFNNFKGLLAHYKADEMPPFLSCVEGGCESGMLIMLGRNGGRRVYVRTKTLPPMFAEMNRMFEDMRRQPSTIKYWAGKDIPGLEVLFADDNVDAIAVWKNGSDFRLLTADNSRREEIDRELHTRREELSSDEQYAGDDDYGELHEAIRLESEKREYENYAWSNFAAGALTGPAAQPAEIEFIPLKDALQPKPDEEQWKARTSALEIRTDDSGIYKVTAGKVAKIKSGVYSDPVITPNGRWVVATKYDDEVGKLVRINLTTGREFPVDTSEIWVDTAFAYVASVNRIVIGREEEYREYGPGALDPEYSLLDPETGIITKPRGEIRPIAQQTYRALQPTTKPFEYWVAIADKGQTVFGTYDTRTFSVKPLLKLSNIEFESSNMWVDAAEAKLYFVYNGQLLSAPLNVPR